MKTSSSHLSLWNTPATISCGEDLTRVLKKNLSESMFMYRVVGQKWLVGSQGNNQGISFIHEKQVDKRGFTVALTASRGL